jgi:hypothetical protein
MNGAERFWLLTFPASADVENCRVLQTALSIANEPPFQQATAAIAVEIIQCESSCWSVFVSLTDSADSPRRLRCILAFSNDPAWCNAAAQFGLSVIDADIELVGRALTVTADAYALRASGEGASPKPTELMRVSYLPMPAEPQGAGSSSSSSLGLVYQQRAATPDLARPDSVLVGRSVDSGPNRSAVRQVNSPGIQVFFEDKVLYPDLFRLAPQRPVAAHKLWVGDVKGWYPGAMGPVERFHRSSVFGSPSFVFDELELVGFRTEVPSGDTLSTLVELLNFHLAPTGAVPMAGGSGPIDFRYCAATATVVIELLRYGKMRARSPQPPFEAADFMSQHELLVRVLVGRVDDDTSQARDPAIFVPAIFVDNPWSKAIGRCLQGFPKMLAEFASGTAPLDMTGHAKTGAGELVPLHAVTNVRLVDRPGATSLPAAFLTLDCPDASDGSADQFFPPPALPLLSTALLRRAPFEQFDFQDEEFRRSFAKGVLTDGFHRFRSVQVSPIDEIGNLPKAWITGRGEVTNVKVAFPVGVATLTLAVPPSSPQPWKLLCDVLGNGQSLAFPTGDWYRLRCSMQLAVDDALE